MPKPVDVFITEAELAEGRKAKRTSCLKVDKEALRPVHCVSRPGISTHTLFTRTEPLPTGRYLTDKEMATMYDKFVGTSSLNNTAVRLEQEEREVSQVQASPSSSTAVSNSRTVRAPYLDSGDRAPPPPPASVAVAMAAAGCDLPSQVHPPAVDDQARERAAAAAAMKYVAPRIAKKYGITQSITPAGPRAAAAARGRSGTAAAASGRGGGRLQAVDSTSSFAASGGGDGRPPRPRSAAFNTTSRDQAQRAGSKLVWGGPVDVPAPGKYTPKYSALDKAQHAPVWSRPGAGGAGADGAATAAAGGGAGGGVRRPASAPAHRSPDDGGTDPSAPLDAQAAAAAAQAGASAAAAVAAARRSLGRSLSSQGAAGGGGGAAAAAAAHAARVEARVEARSQLQQRHEELFGAAHRVHPRRPEGPPGSSSFKAVQRKSLYDTPPPAGNLFGEYYKEGYDSLTRKASRPPSAFRTQSQRHCGGGPLGETGPALGPGVYGGEQPPGTHTGRHVPSGHPGLSRTPDWSRTTPRPTSAPPVRPPPASAMHQGYWGPDGPAASLFPDDPEYAEMSGVRMLQERTSQRTPGIPSRKPSVQQQQGQGQAWQQGQQPPSTSGAAPIATITAQTFSNSGGAAQEAGAAAGSGAAAAGPRAVLCYVGPERYGELTSAGLSKRVPGGAFGTATREGTCYAMRAIANPSITPPASVLVPAAKDLQYEYDIAVQGHRGRPPAWGLPPNRNALSAQWVEAAATAYTPTF